MVSAIVCWVLAGPALTAENNAPHPALSVGSEPWRALQLESWLREKRMKIICLECVFLFSSNFAGGHIYSWRERCDILACHLCSKGQSSAGTAFIVLFAPLYFFLQCVNFMVVEKMKSCFWKKQQHKPANCAQHNGILMYSSCWHSVFLW